MKKRPIIIDTDPGIDDAAALAIALRSPNLDVKLISTVAGNVDIEKTTTNALKLVEFLKADVSIAKGMANPLLRKIQFATDVHGESGMEGYDFPALHATCIKEHAVEAIRKILMTSKEKITLVPIAALTNIAVLLTMYPEVKEKIDEIIMMGGCFGKGNTNTASEFNIFVDPHAAKIVFDSGLKITMVPLDVTRAAAIHTETSEQIAKSGELGQMLYSLFKHYRGGSIKTGLKIHDACAIAYLLRPDIFKTEHLYVDVVCEGLAAGALVADGFMKLSEGKKANIIACTEIQAAAFESWFLQEVSK